MLYLETAQPKVYLTSQIYLAMKNNHLNDDLIVLVMKDLQKIGFSIDDEEICSTLNKNSLKALTNKKNQQLATQEFESMKSEHQKVRKIIHTYTNVPQEYPTNGQFNNSKKIILFNLRSRRDNNFKHIFFQQSPGHALSCQIIAEHLIESEKNIIECKK